MQLWQRMQVAKEPCQSSHSNSAAQPHGGQLLLARLDALEISRSLDRIDSRLASSRHLGQGRPAQA